MQLKSLKVFCDVVDQRSFSRAAEANGITQSGASQMVGHLERRLGVKLIDRSKRPFVLTREGEVYYEGCRKLMRTYCALEEEVRSLQDEVAGQVNVASIYSIGLSHMNQIVRDFRARFPKATVHLEYQHPQNVYELVERDQADIGLVSYPRSSRTISANAWREEPMVVVCAPDHALASRRSVALTDLAGLSVVGYNRDLPIRRAIDRILANHQVHVEVVMEFDNIDTIKEAIGINAGISLLPEPTVAREVSSGELVTVPLEGERMVRPLGIIRRKGRELGRTAERFMHLLHDSAKLHGSAKPSFPATNGRELK